MNISTETAIEILTHPDDISIRIGLGENGKFFPKISLNEDGRVLVTARWASHPTKESVIKLIKEILEACLCFKTSLGCSFAREDLKLCERMLNQDVIDSIIEALEAFDYVDTSSFSFPDKGV